MDSVYINLQAEQETGLPRLQRIPLTHVTLAGFATLLVIAAVGAAASSWSREGTRTLVRNAQMCVFIHGAGGPDTAPYTASDEGYWGMLHERTPQCGERRFMHEDTLHVRRHGSAAVRAVSTPGACSCCCPPAQRLAMLCVRVGGMG